MRWNWKFAIITAILLTIEIIIALYVHDKFIRPFIGDVLVVVLLYTGFRTILKISPLKIAIGVLIFSFSMELLQYFNIVELLHLQNSKAARIIIGTTFDFTDLLAYAIGTVSAYFIDTKIKVNK